MTGKSLPSLGKKGPDRVAAALRSIVSAVPFAGGLLAEIITEVIPNQRLDRIERFLLALTKEMSRIGNDNYPTSESPQLELLESGIRAAAATNSSTKIEYLARSVAKGLTHDESETVRAQRVARIVTELDPEEMIILLSHTERSAPGANEFYEQHAAIFDIPTLVIGSDQSVRERNAQYQAAERHLIALGLVSEEIRLDHDTGIPKRFGSEIEKDVHITMVGRLVLHHVGLIDAI